MAAIGKEAETAGDYSWRKSSLSSEDESAEAN